MNYWYLSRNNDYPDAKWSVRSVQLFRRYTVVEMTREATERELFVCDLIYLGYGWWSDEHVQENYETYRERLI